MSVDDEDDVDADSGDESDRMNADLSELDDTRDREELRKRYFTLLQELRVVLPGVQVLLAFLLTAPFAQRFTELDDAGRVSYGVTLAAAMLSAVCLLAPTVYHRIADRTERVARLRWGIRLTVAGLFCLAVALVAGLWCVARLVFGNAPAWTLAALAAVFITALWVVLPSVTGRGPAKPAA